MDSYEVRITPRAENMLNECVTYIAEKKLNPDAADAVFEDALDTATQLENVAGSLGYCRSKGLRELGYHKINFKRHDYLMIYKICDMTVVVEAVYHQSQDYENIFAEDIGIR